MKPLLLLIAAFFLFSGLERSKKVTTIFLIGDSTVADYANNYDEGDYYKTRYPITGWGQVFYAYTHPDSLVLLRKTIVADSIVIVNKARGGRSTRTFFEEGRWSVVHQAIKPGDLVLMQFGHNDAAENKPERYVTVSGYKEYLRLYINQTREKGGIPVVLTPVNRNYPWDGNTLKSSHGEYAEAARAVAEELEALLIDLTDLSCTLFTKLGQEYVTEKFFMNLEPGKYEAYPGGSKDNTHFQPEGAKAIAQLVFDELKKINATQYIKE